MKRSLLSLALATSALVSLTGFPAKAQSLDLIQSVVIIYAENRSFDNLYGHFPGANGLQNVTPDMVRQLDRDGTPLKELPPVWGGLTAPGVVPPVTQAQTEHLPNALFA